MIRKFIFLFFVTIFLISCNKEEEATPQRVTDLIPPNVHLTLGNPSNATTDENNPNNYLIEKPQYTLSYSKDRGTPNWVSWHVSKDWLGSSDRQNDFRADNTLPADWYRVGTSAYMGSGFDRGHNIPSADRTKTIEDNSATFLMTNMIPQAPEHNRGMWANLEDYTRDLVQDGNEVYVIMGSYGVGGVGSNGSANSIDNGRVTVPKRIWKVIVVLPEGTDDLKRINSTTRVVAVNTPNVNNVNSNWGSYRTSVDAIEKETGYDILSAIPDQIEGVLEAKIDNGPTQ